MWRDQSKNTSIDLIDRNLKEECVCLTGLCQQQVIQVSVSDSQDVGDDAVTSWKDVHILD